MRILVRFISALLVLLVILALAGGGAAFYALRKDQPQTDGSLQLQGLKAPVDVYRDRYGVPHIYARSDHDLFFAQGYVHAQDRFWQMEFWRRTGQGRLSELFGGSVAGTDRYLRTLGVHRVAALEVEQLGAEERALLEAYSAGVNAYLAQRGDGRGLEFSLLGLTGVRVPAEPWTPVNSLTWLKLMALNLGGNMDAELLRLQLTEALGPEKAAELYPAVYPEGRPVILPPAGRIDPRQARAVWQSLQSYRALAGGPDSGLGSNNWVLAGSRTTTGMPILANDPHLSIQMPSIWYEVDLQCIETGPDCRYNVAGFSFAGVPGVVLGHNQRIAWGFTNVNPDVQDLYIETLEGDAVRFNGQLVPLTTVEEVIHVQGRLPETYKPGANEQTRYDEPTGQTIITLKVRIVPHHGPLMSDVDTALAATGKALALRWTALEPAHTIRALFSFNRAANWEEFRAALADFQAPSQNVVYADVDGHIGWQVPGLVPIRPEGCDGVAPAPGDGSCEWQGYLAYDDLPRSYDPPQGYIATANNAPYGPDYPHVLGYDWDFGYRAMRIVELLASREKHSLDDLAAIQFDNLDVFAREVMPQLLAVQPTDARAQQALQALRDWDYRTQRDRVGATVFASLFRHLVANTYGDELGEDLAKEYLGAGPLMRTVLGRALADPAAVYWDDVATAGRQESREDIILRSLDEAVAELSEKLGPDMSSWTWGRLHTATFENQSLGQSNALGGLLKTLLNRGPVPADGGPGIVNNNAWSYGKPYSVNTLPSLRALYDLSALGNSRLVHTTGQSGHPYHPHYDDFIPLWNDGLYHAHYWDRATVEQNAEGHLVLNP
jgi:penicillin amidase